MSCCKDFLQITFQSDRIWFETTSPMIYDYCILQNPFKKFLKHQKKLRLLLVLWKVVPFFAVIYVFVYLFLLLCCFQDKQPYFFSLSVGVLFASVCVCVCVGVMIFFGQYQYVGKPHPPPTTHQKRKHLHWEGAPIFIQHASAKILSPYKNPHTHTHTEKGCRGRRTKDELKAHEA